VVLVRILMLKSGFEDEILIKLIVGVRDGQKKMSYVFMCYVLASYVT
jgi:hypothetical protein